MKINFFRFFSPKGPPFDFKNLKTQMIGSIFDLEKNRNMFWNQGSQLFHLPHETEFFHEIFIFSTNLMSIAGRSQSIAGRSQSVAGWTRSVAGRSESMAG